MPVLDVLTKVATRRGVAVVEDAAEAIGSEYRGRKAGSFGDAATFSFHGSKTLTTGEGGMLLSNDEKIFRRALFLRDHGRPPGDKLFYNTEVAYKYKMSSMQAALGLAQLERIEELVARKREIFGWYKEELGGMEGITLNCEHPGTKNTYWMVTVVLDPAFGIRKDALMQRMSEANIDCRPFFHPLSSLPAYAGSESSERARERNTVSYRLSPYAVNLPSGLSMTPEKVKRVCRSLREIVGAGVGSVTAGGAG
jgi:perosamine synthetase